MAHFAELDENNIVLRVIVVNNEELIGVGGQEDESLGVQFCASLFGGNWKQTSYNGNIRKNYAGIGFMYDHARDAFIPPQPFPSWLLNETTCKWEAPKPYPQTQGMESYSWNEDSMEWVIVTSDETTKS